MRDHRLFLLIGSVLLIAAMALAGCMEDKGNSVQPAEGQGKPAAEEYITAGAGPTPALTLAPTTSATLSMPVASFIDDPTIGFAPLTVQFTDLSEGTPTMWLWDFGDGGSSTDQDPTYTYLTPGLYSVTLTSANSAGNSTATGTGKITVLSPASTQSPLSPLAAIIASAIAAVASAGIHMRRRE